MYGFRAHTDDIHDRFPYLADISFIFRQKIKNTHTSSSRKFSILKFLFLIDLISKNIEKENFSLTVCVCVCVLTIIVMMMINRLVLNCGNIMLMIMDMEQICHIEIFHFFF